MLVYESLLNKPSLEIDSICETLINKGSVLTARINSSCKKKIKVVMNVMNRDIRLSVSSMHYK